MTIDEASERVREAEVRYWDAVVVSRRIDADSPTPTETLEQVELQHLLQEAAEEVVAAQTEYQQLEQKDLDERQAKAASELAAVESDLITVIETAEAQASELEAGLTNVLGLSKSRYSLKAVIDGKASRRLLGSEAIFGWLQHRLAGLGLHELGRAQRYQRAPLMEILGLSHLSEGDEQ